jgi:3'-phosphoadenosine 5'-phosphosulfate sulfotransferase (PAPS reductase)/FAD synthetase
VAKRPVSIFSDADFANRVRDSIATIAECFERYKPDQVIVAFNGGKDCIVTLHLAFAFLKVSTG